VANLLIMTIGAGRGSKWRIAMVSASRPAHGLQLTLLCRLLSLIAQCLMLLRRLCGQSSAGILCRFLMCFGCPRLRVSPGAPEDLFLISFAGATGDGEGFSTGPEKDGNLNSFVTRLVPFRPRTPDARGLTHLRHCVLIVIPF
jgi:hypothetical protein